MRLLLDGEDLPSLMVRIRAEMGPHARIVKAERVRTGGVAGFFARERYEVTVEVPDEVRPRLGHRLAAPAGTGPDPAATGGLGLDALLAAANAAESADRFEPPVLDGALEQRATADPSLQVSTAGDTFADVLESMRQLVRVVADAPPTVEQPGGGRAAPDQPGESIDEAVEPQQVRATPPRTASPPGLEPAPSGSSVNALLELGVPPRLLAGFADPKASVPLSVLVRRFDPPPSLSLAAGRVIVVVGDGNEALATARQMAHRAGTDPYDIVLAGQLDPVAGHGRRLQTPAAVARYRSRIPSTLPSIVAIGVGPEQADWSAAAALIAAWEPNQAWAVVDARRKVVDLRRWLRGVGARRSFDAVAATSTFEAQSPGTVLTLGTPVGWVDGLPASRVVWAAILSERLADDARWD